MTGLRQTRRTSANYREEVESSTEAYDPLSHEPGTLVTMCTFHDEAGGTEYTGLTHRALRELDLTELMRLGRGILIGRMRAPTARVLVDGVEREPADRATFVRIIVPVRQIDASPAKHIPKAEKTPD
jgi:NifB/MoaA-like Fe-S oxidoreductase